MTERSTDTETGPTGVTVNTPTSEVTKHRTDNDKNPETTSQTNRPTTKQRHEHAEPRNDQPHNAATRHASERQRAYLDALSGRVRAVARWEGSLSAQRVRAGALVSSWWVVQCRGRGDAKCRSTRTGSGVACTGLVVRTGRVATVSGCGVVRFQAGRVMVGGCWVVMSCRCAGNGCPDRAGAQSLPSDAVRVLDCSVCDGLRAAGCWSSNRVRVESSARTA